MTCALQHRRAKVDTGDVERRVAAQQAEDQVAGSAAAIEDPSALWSCEQPDRPAAPALVQTAREDAIREVVAGCDAGEHFADERPFIAGKVTGRGRSHGSPTGFPH